jgi:hypothetical protein
VCRSSDTALADWIARLNAAGAPIRIEPELARGVFRVYAISRP